MKQISQELYDRVPDELKGDYEVKPEKWIPNTKIGDRYYFTSLDGCRTSERLFAENMDADCFMNGNGFTTKEKAKQAETILRPIRRVIQYLVENNTKLSPDGFYHICHNEKTGDTIFYMYCGSHDAVKEVLSLLDKGVL